MNTKEMSIDELFYLSLEENEVAKTLLFKSFLIIINSNLKKYKRIANMLDISKEELHNEALYGIADALKCYRVKSNTSVKTFIDLCIKRRIGKCLRSASCVKRNRYQDIICFNEEYMNIIDVESDPLILLLKKDKLKQLNNELIKELSSFESSVYKYIIKGYNYQEIAKILHKDVKQIDNALQRIRQKSKKVKKIACI